MPCPPAGRRCPHGPRPATRDGVPQHADAGRAQTPQASPRRCRPASRAGAEVRATDGVGAASSGAPRPRRGGRLPVPEAFPERWCPLMVLRRFKVRAHERGLLFRDREFAGVLRPGRHALWDPFWKVAVDLVSVRDAWLVHKDLDVIVRSGALGDEAVVVDLKDHERAVVFVDGRVEAVLKPGLYALWTVFHDVKVETFDVRAVRFDHANLAAIVQAKGATALLETTTVEAGHAGLLFKDGRHEATLAPGVYAAWKGTAKVRVVDVDLREQVADVAGQEIMTAD